MTHPHHFFLNEFKLAIDKLVPLTPGAIKEEAQTLHKELEENHDATEGEIGQALATVGRKEYPYRKAYHELCAGDSEQRLQAAVFERLDEDVKKKIQEMTSHGVILEDYVKSELFETQMNAEERYQVLQAIELADDVLDHQCDERARHRTKAYKELVEKHKGEAYRLQGLIDQIRSMANASPEQASDILASVNRLEEGWSVTSTDPNEEEIVKEIEYWKTVIGDGEGSADLLQGEDFDELME